MSDRQDALDLVTAAMVVVVQTQDVELSAEIIADAGDKYGRTYVEELLAELVASDFVNDISPIPKDVLMKRALLSMLRPLPYNWMLTRN